ncbi:Iduronate sulfatase [Planctomycetales bacterium 10988]|nr:Iduronate sulfatase [Planctomycetales bacterium 10988]
MPKSFYKSLGFVFLLCLLAKLSLANDRPNVLMIYVDDLRPMTRDYGHPQMQTPNFDRLAKSGLRFENVYCQVPTCGASRASLMTSIYPTRLRFPDFLTWAERDAPGRATLPQRFKDSGYTTISNGKIFHHQTDTQKRSWSEPAWRPEINGRTYYNEATAEFMETQTDTRRLRNGKLQKKVPMFEPGLVDPMKTNDGLIAEKTMNDLERLSKEKEPFFIACGFAKPHMPFYSPAPTWTPYPVDGIELAEFRELPQPTPESIRTVREQFSYSFMTPDLKRQLEYNTPEFHRYMRQGYYASVTHADNLLGRILDKLEELQLDEKTIVIVLGDHGFLLGEHNEWAKNQLLHDALRTAMWMKGPGIAQDAEVSSQVEFVDVYPTLCELASIELPSRKIHGKSFAKVLQKPKAKHRDAAYTRFGIGDALTTDDYFYVLWQPSGEKENALLIDRKQDPLFQSNLSGQEEYAAIETQLHKQLLGKIRQARQIKTTQKKAEQKAAQNNGPQVEQKPLRIQATVESQNPHGVVLAHGGYRFGYSLHFEEGFPVFSIRNDGKLTTLKSKERLQGKVTILAMLDAQKITLQSDGKLLAQAPSPGLLLKQPVGKFTVGEDFGDAVGDYEGPHPFNGKIHQHRVITKD